MKFGDVIQTADWKTEKHIPVIDAPTTVSAGAPFMIMLSVGKEIPHPHTVEHHISWIDVYFKPDGDKALYQVGHIDLVAHGATVKGDAAGAVRVYPMCSLTLAVQESGKLFALASCNIHGLWEGGLDIKVV